MKDIRKFYLIGEINEDKYKTYSLFQDECIKKSKSKPIEIEMSSPGGGVISGLAIYDKIRSCPAHVTINCFGMVMSAASFILLAADTKRASANTRFMVHEVSGGAFGSLVEVKKEVQEIEYYSTLIQSLIVQNTKLRTEQIDKLFKRTTYFSSAKAKEWGFIDQIIGEK